MWRHLDWSWTSFASHLRWVALRFQCQHCSERAGWVPKLLPWVYIQEQSPCRQLVAHGPELKPSSLSAITFTRQRQSRICTRVTFRKASGSGQGRAQTCQVKKGMSPSCKHFLSGREHFLNPGTTTSIAYSPANSRQRLSLCTSQLHRQLILTVKAKRQLWVNSPMWVPLEPTKNGFLCSFHIIKGESGVPAKKKWKCSASWWVHTDHSARWMSGCLLLCDTNNSLHSLVRDTEANQIPLLSTRDCTLVPQLFV